MLVLLLFCVNLHALSCKYTNCKFCTQRKYFTHQNQIIYENFSIQTLLRKNAHAAIKTRHIYLSPANIACANASPYCALNRAVFTHHASLNERIQLSLKLLRMKHKCLIHWRQDMENCACHVSILSSWTRWTSPRCAPPDARVSAGVTQRQTPCFLCDSRVRVGQTMNTAST